MEAKLNVSPLFVPILLITVVPEAEVETVRCKCECKWLFEFLVLQAIIETNLYKPAVTLMSCCNMIWPSNEIAILSGLPKSHGVNQQAPTWFFTCHETSRFPLLAS